MTKERQQDTDARSKHLDQLNESFSNLQKAFDTMNDSIINEMGKAFNMGTNGRAYYDKMNALKQSLTAKWDETNKKRMEKNRSII